MSADRSQGPSGRPPIEAITFDFWNTIVRANDDQARWRVASWIEILDRAGHATTPEQIGEVFRAEWLLHQESWKRNEQYLGVHAARGAVERLELAVDVPTTEALVDAFVTEGEKAEFEPCPGVVDALRALHDAGVRIGIICDVGFTPATGLRRLLQRFDALDLFTGWSFSDEVGWYKPAPQMFEHALGYLATTAAETAHIGDIRRTDVAGAKAAGFLAIRYRGVSDDTDAEQPEGDIVIDHHDELLAALGLP